MPTPRSDCLIHARCSLEGLSVGDAFGKQFCAHPDVVEERLIEERALPVSPWRFTDDTQMALSIVSILRQHGAIDQKHLAQSFAERYDSTRGYGRSMHGQKSADTGWQTLE